MEEDVVFTRLAKLCRLINRTIVTKSVDLLPWQASPPELGLDCNVLVESYLPKTLFLLSLITILIAYYFYYRIYVVSVPKVICADETRLKALKKHCPVFFEEFWPTIWAPQAHMQTVIRVAIQTFPKSERKRYKFAYEFL